MKQFFQKLRYKSVLVSLRSELWKLLLYLFFWLGGTQVIRYWRETGYSIELRVEDMAGIIGILAFWIACIIKSNLDAKRGLERNDVEERYGAWLSGHPVSEEEVYTHFDVPVTQETKRKSKNIVSPSRSGGVDSCGFDGYCGGVDGD